MLNDERLWNFMYDIFNAGQDYGKTGDAAFEELGRRHMRALADQLEESINGKK